MIDARSYFTVSGSPISEAIAAHALRNREEVLSRLMAVASANLQTPTIAMEAVKDILSWVRPSGATTAYPWFNDGRDSRPFCEALADAGVLFVPGDCFGAPEHMRIGFGAQAGKRPVPPQISALCEAIYSYDDTDWSEQVLTGHGARFDYVCDSVGAPTLDGSLKVAALCGHIALFGQSGGVVEQIAVDRLAAKSLTITRPILFDYIADADKRTARMRSFTAMLEAGALTFPEPTRFPLDQAGQAQAMLEERRTDGPIVLVP